MICYITIVTSTNNWERTSQCLYINEDYYEQVYDLSECPEDAIIGRDLKDCGDLADAIKLGFSIGKSFNEIQVNRITVDDLDEFDIVEYLESIK